MGVICWVLDGGAGCYVVGVCRWGEGTAIHQSRFHLKATRFTLPDFRGGFAVHSCGCSKKILLHKRMDISIHRVLIKDFCISKA